MVELEAELAEELLHQPVSSHRFGLGRGLAGRRRGRPTKVVHVRQKAKAGLPPVLHHGPHHLGPRQAGRCQAEGHGDRLEEPAEEAEGEVGAVRLAEGEVVVCVLDVPRQQGVARPQGLGQLGQGLLLAGGRLGEAVDVCVVVHRPRLVGRVPDERRRQAHQLSDLLRI